MIGQRSKKVVRITSTFVSPLRSLLRVVACLMAASVLSLSCVSFAPAAGNTAAGVLVAAVEAGRPVDDVVEAVLVATTDDTDGNTESDLPADDKDAAIDESISNVPSLPHSSDVEMDSGKKNDFDVATKQNDGVVSEAAPVGVEATSAIAASGVLYVSTSGSDVTGTGSLEKPLASLTLAVQRAADSAEIVVVGNLVSLETTTVGDKNIVVRGQAGSSIPTLTSPLAIDLFSVSSGSLTIKNLTVDGASLTFDRRAVDVLDKNGSLVLDGGATIKNWYTTGSRGAVRLHAQGASFTMKSGSLITNCVLVGASSYVGGAAVSISAGRDPGSPPSASYRSAFVMESGSSIVGCTTKATTNVSYSGGGAVRAIDANVLIAQGASIRDSKLEYRSTSGVLLDPTSTRQGGGALFAYNCKVTMAGTIDKCAVVAAANTGKGNFYAGGGGMFVYATGCTPAAGVDCRTNVSGTLSNCSAIAGGGAYYWSDSNSYGEGANLWVGPSGPRRSADEVVANVYDAFLVSGTFTGCFTTDAGNSRTATLSNSGDYDQYGIGGGAVSGACNGLIVLDEGTFMSNCNSGSEGGAVSSYGTSVFCLDRSGGGGPVIEFCSAGGIGGGISIGAASHLENVTVKNCVAGLMGGGLYVYSGSTTLYDCMITGCSAGSYGGGIMQHVGHDLFVYGGTVTGNSAITGGGGIALAGHNGGSLSSPRGISFNYPANLNGGYTNPVYYPSTVLASKILAPCVVVGNVQGSSGKTSNLWTPNTSPTTRISESGNFLLGSKVGVTVADGSTSFNKVGTSFGNASQLNLNLGSFSCDADPVLSATYNGGNMVWAQGYTVRYEANTPVGVTASGSVPFDGVLGIPNSYLRTGGTTLVLGANTLTVDGYLFRGWSTSATATTALYQPNVTLSYNSTIDSDGDGRIVLYAVWEKIDYVCQIIRDSNNDGTPDTFYKVYSTVSGAFRDAQKGDRIEMLKNALLVDFANEVDGYPADGVVFLASSATGVTLTAAPLAQPVADASPWLGSSVEGTPKAVLTRSVKGSAVASLVVEGGLTLGNVVLDGACTPAQASSGLGVRGSRALVTASGEGAIVLLSRGASIRYAWNPTGVGGGLFVTNGAVGGVSSGSSIVGCTAQDGGGVAVASDSASTATRLTISDGSITTCAATRFGGGVYVGTHSSASFSGLSTVASNKADCSGGGFYIDTLGSLVVTDGTVSGNASTAMDQSSAPGRAFVGGIGHGAYAGGPPLITVSGDAVVSGNFGRPAGSTSSVDPGPSNVLTERTEDSYSLGVADSGLGSAALVGVTAVSSSLLTPGSQFAVMTKGSASTAIHLEAFFNDSADLHGDAGEGSAVCWRAPRVSVSFVKTGFDQTTGVSVMLGGAKFNVYRYVGIADLNSATINAGNIDLATTSSLQWAPLTGSNGEEGAAGNPSNVPHDFISSEGISGGSVRGGVQLAGLTPGSWYMLVETGSPVGYQKPTGQWAFKVVELPASSGKYIIDAKTMLARKGADGLLPPAFATSIHTAQGSQSGLFLPNVPIFPLPYAGGAPWLIVVLGAGSLFVLIAITLHIRRSPR